MAEIDPAPIHKLVVAQPLEDLIRKCAVYCDAYCCGLSAFDVNAYTMLYWIRDSGCEQALLAAQQLEAAISEVSALEGRVRSASEFCHTWDDGHACAAFLRKWHDEISRAVKYDLDGCPSPAERLAHAKQSGGSDYYLEVRRLADDAEALRQSGNQATARKVFSLLAVLDVRDERIASSVKRAQEVLTEMTGWSAS
jgi:hypothetical protein